LTEAHAC